MATGQAHASTSHDTAVLAKHHGTDFVLKQVQGECFNLAAVSSINSHDFVITGASKAVDPGHTVTNAGNDA